MTGAEIIAFAEFLIDDSIASAQQLNLVNMAIRDVSKEAPYFNIATITFLANAATASLPNLFKGMDKIGSLKYKSPADISDLTTEGIPTSYYYRGLSQISIWPVPIVETVYTALFHQGYADIATLNDSPTVIPADYHDMMAYFIAWRSHDYFGNNMITQEKSQMFNSEYFRMLSEFKQMVDSNFYEYDSMKTQDVLPKSSRWLSGSVSISGL